MLVAAYIPPSANTSDRSEALSILYQTISEQQKAHPDRLLVATGDFNHTDLKVLPQLHQHVDFPTRGNNILDHVYTNHKGTRRKYQASLLPHLGLSDHITIMLRPVYRQKVRVIRPTQKKYVCGQRWPVLL